MKISELLKEKATISFEVFPPKNKEGDLPFTIPLRNWQNWTRILSVLHTEPADLPRERPWRSHRPLKISIRSSP